MATIFQHGSVCIRKVTNGRYCIADSSVMRRGAGGIVLDSCQFARLMATMLTRWDSLLPDSVAYLGGDVGNWIAAGMPSEAEVREMILTERQAEEYARRAVEPRPQPVDHRAATRRACLADNRGPVNDAMRDASGGREL